VGCGLWAVGCGLWRSHWFDIFPNIDKARLVAAPVFVMHGTADKEIPVHHGIGLADAVPSDNQYPPYASPRLSPAMLCRLDLTRCCAAVLLCWCGVVFSWFIEGAGHNNIEIHWRDEYYARVRTFLRSVEHDSVRAAIAQHKAQLAGKGAGGAAVLAAAPGAPSASAAAAVPVSGAPKKAGADADEDAAKSVPMEKVTVNSI
jgi:hypothetical protein